MAVDLVALKAANEKRWANARLTRGAEFQKYAQKIVANKARYQDVESRTGVHWLFVAVSHYRESTLDFTKQLGQGDPINQVSTRVPAGRGPFKNFEDSAVDALVNCAPYAARNKDWSIGGMLTYLERYNGLGYAGGPSSSRGPNAGKRFPPQPSPYIWSGTDQYTVGKYVADHDFRPDVVDKQLGCAGLILAVMAMDSSIVFNSKPATTPALPPPKPALDGVWLQTSLNKLGAAIEVDGVVGPATKAAVWDFQRKNGLDEDGIAGPKTIAAITVALTPPDPPKGFWARLASLFG